MGGLAPLLGDWKAHDSRLVMSESDFERACCVIEIVGVDNCLAVKVGWTNGVNHF